MTTNNQFSGWQTRPSSPIHPPPSSNTTKKNTLHCSHFKALDTTLTQELVDKVFHVLFTIATRLLKVLYRWVFIYGFIFGSNIVFWFPDFEFNIGWEEFYRHIPPSHWFDHKHSAREGQRWQGKMFVWNRTNN